jgi:hypothetical protein
LGRKGKCIDFKGAGKLYHPKLKGEVMDSITIEETENNLDHILAIAIKEPLLISRNDKPSVVIMPFRYYYNIWNKARIGSEQVTIAIDIPKDIYEYYVNKADLLEIPVEDLIAMVIEEAVRKEINQRI